MRHFFSILKKAMRTFCILSNESNESFIDPTTRIYRIQTGDDYVELLVKLVRHVLDLGVVSNNVDARDTLVNKTGSNLEIKKTR